MIARNYESDATGAANATGATGAAHATGPTRATGATGATGATDDNDELDILEAAATDIRLYDATDLPWITIVIDHVTEATTLEDVTPPRAGGKPP